MNLARRLAEAQLALMVLTRLPAGRIEGDAPPVGDTVWAFPLVGMIVGGIAGAMFWLAEWFGVPGLAAGLLAIGAAVLVTGGLHEDGLADVADGFGGGRDRARKLEIMRDSRLGSYGALALVLVVGVSASAIAVAGSWSGFVAVGALSRALMAVPMAVMRPARDDGLGAGAVASISARFWVAMGIAAGLGVAVLGVWALVLAVAATFVVMALARWQIGGQTGDVLGTVQKLSEMAAWLTLSARCCAA